MTTAQKMKGFTPLEAERLTHCYGDGRRFFLANIRPAGGQKLLTGFTLVELMMAIAITALLAAIILASLNRGRNQSADAAVQSGFQNVRAQAEAYGAGSGYGGLCADARIQEMFSAIKAAAGRPAGEEVRCGADANEWVGAELLKSSSNTWWCADHKGFVGAVPNATKNFSVLANITTDGNIDCD